MVSSPRLERFLEGWRAGRKLVVLTAYDSWQAELAESGGADLLLVGDSLGMVEQGRDSTAEVTLEHIMYHTRMTARGRKELPIVADLPAHSYDTPEMALESSKLLLSCGADAVKFEGNPHGIAEAILGAGIPVMGHLGLLPQTAREFKVQGKEENDASAIRADARALEAAGCFSLVLECIPLSLGQTVTSEIGMPTIGIGAGAHTSGQVLVFHDLLHLNTSRKAKFVPQNYQHVGDIIRGVLNQFSSDVRSGVYPSDRESYH